MKKAIILIDYINDFVLDDGALTVGKPAQDIKDDIAANIKALGEDDLLMIINDLHILGEAHPENKSFPPHALKDSIGRENFVQEEIDKALAKTIYIDKTRYSAFFNTDLLKILKDEKVNQIYLSGVCTDICVLHTAIDAYNLDVDAKILKNCVATFNPAGHEFALSHFENTLGFELCEKV